MTPASGCADGWRRGCGAWGQVDKLRAHPAAAASWAAAGHGCGTRRSHPVFVGCFPGRHIVLTLALISGTSLHAVSHASPPPGFSYWLKSYIFTVFLLAALKVNMHPVVLNLNVGSICIKNMNWSRLLCFASAPRRVRGGVATVHSLLRTHLGAFTGCRKPRRGQPRHNLVSQS